MSGRSVQGRLRKVGLVLCAGLGGLSAASCSSSSSQNSVASIPKHGSNSPGAGGGQSVAQGDRALVDYAHCLRSHGVNVADPVSQPGHSGLVLHFPTPGPSTNGALAACNHFIADVTQGKAAGAQRELAAWLPALIRYAECMRNHDIAMLDPSPLPSPEGLVTLGSVPGINNDFGRYSPQFRAADATCRHLLPTAVRVHDNGTGP
jgi:hypothetical protein